MWIQNSLVYDMVGIPHRLIIWIKLMKTIRGARVWQTSSDLIYTRDRLTEDFSGKLLVELAGTSYKGASRLDVFINS